MADRSKSKKSEKSKAVKRKNARDWVKRWRAVGACIKCGLPVAINPITDKPYWRCFKHRLYAAKYVRKYRTNKEANSLS